MHLRVSRKSKGGSAKEQAESLSVDSEGIKGKKQKIAVL